MQNSIPRRLGLRGRLLATLAACLTLFATGASGQVYERVVTFGAAAFDFSRGYGPSAPLVLGSDGNFCGTTIAGGTTENGTIFRITPAGILTTLVEFTGNAGTKKGTNPSAGLIQGSDGNFYGTTEGGGSAGLGTVFRMTPAGALTTLVEFTGNGPSNRGSRPSAELIQDDDGDFYGTTSKGGATNHGTVFRLTPFGVVSTLVEFTGNGTVNKGSNPVAALCRGNDGNFYGTTKEGGSTNNGTVFRMTPAGALTTLVEFIGNGANNRGSFPSASLTQGSNGAFYGTTNKGGSRGNGTIFRITANGVLNTLADLSLTPYVHPSGIIYDDNSVAGLLEGSDGNFYGSKLNWIQYGPPVAEVFRITPDGVLTTLVELTGPVARLAQGDDGSFYGTTGQGPFYGGAGTVFRLSPAGTLSILTEFNVFVPTTGSNGPSAPAVLQALNGNYYGTTAFGGVGSAPGDGFSGLGTIFRLTPAGEMTTLVAFTGNGAVNKGAAPQSALTQGDDGNYYGTTAFGGIGFVAGNGYSGFGTVFRVTPAGELATLAQFTGNGDSNRGSIPYAALLKANDGNFYGATVRGGVDDFGTIFRMTPVGAVTTLVEFNGDKGSNKGRYPYATLIQGRDGNFYGSTERGGANDLGTIFRMTPAGNLTTLVEFTGNGANSRGSYPYAELLQASDGNFYGSTFYSDVLGRDDGTVFRMTPSGELTTLVFLDGNPAFKLMEREDGFLYGTTVSGGMTGGGTVFRMTLDGAVTTLAEFTFDLFSSGQATGGFIFDSDGNLFGAENLGFYRLIFPGSPNIWPIDRRGQGFTSGVVSAKVNARGPATVVSVEFGSDGVAFPNSVPVAINLRGFQSKLVGTTLDNLNPGTTYYYRFRAISSAGTTLSPVQTLSTLGEPMARVDIPSDILPTSVRLNGTVNAHNYNATTIFEYGTDGNTFPNQIPAAPATVTGASDVAVSAVVAGLMKGTPYFYRIVATNVGGTTVSGTQNFVTLIEPAATVGGSFALTTTSARVSGSVRARNSDSQVFFDYGTDGVTFPNSVAATPRIATGDVDTPVSADLTSLAQGVTYHYRVRAVSAGGVGESSSAPLNVAVISGFTRQFPIAVAAEDRHGFLTVKLLPDAIAAMWRFKGEQQWRPSGTPVNGLTTGDRVIEFRPVAGYSAPLPETVSVVSGDESLELSREYFEVGGSGGTGRITIQLKPDSLTQKTLPPRQRAQWRLLGEDDTHWRESGVESEDLPAGSYLVECKAVEALLPRTTPPPIPVTVVAGGRKVASVIYYLADPQTGAPPTVLPFETVSTSTDLPYGYVGQLRSDLSSGSGFVVKVDLAQPGGSRVVATAAHLVYDELNHSAATGLQWLLQRDKGTYEPKPQIPRGYYLFAGYAAQRDLEGTPGESLPASQNLDAAAVYFTEDVGRSGFSGYLASDSTPNEWLASPALKTLVGYPIAGILAANQGRMHATPPENATFAHSSGFTYVTSDIRSSGGGSGGPLCVQFEGGAYYPAAIFLGGANQTVVRAIDSGVIELFRRAEISGNGGPNTGDGGITHTETLPDAGSIGASLKVVLSPVAAVVGGRWSIGRTGTQQLSGAQLNAVAPGTYTVFFAAVPGFIAPSPTGVVLNAGNVATVTGDYVEILPSVVTNGGLVRAIHGKAFSFKLDATNQPTRFVVSGLNGTNLTLNETTGLLSGTPPANGTFELSVRAENGAGPGPASKLTLIVTEAGKLVVRADPAQGSVKVMPKSDNSVFPQDEVITLTARPDVPGFLFAGWDFSGAAPSSLTRPTTTFRMSENVVATANFLANPFLKRSGTYTGLIGSATVPTGAATIQVAWNGRFSLRFLLGNHRYAQTGVFDLDGNFTGTIHYPGLSKLDVTLRLALGETDPAELTGSIVVDGITHEIQARQVVRITGSPVPQAGRHTLAFPPDPTQTDVAMYPAGWGYALVTVSAAGAVRSAGQLGDGVSFSVGGVIASRGRWAVYTQPYGKRSLLGGVLTFSQAAAPAIDAITGTLRWEKPATSGGRYRSGFAGVIEVGGSRYEKSGLAAPGISPWNLSIGAGVLSFPIAGTATLDAHYRFSLGGAAAGVASIKLDPTTGLFRGRVGIGSDPVRRFNGVVIEGQHTGRGLLLLPDRTAPVTLDPPNP